MLSDGMSLMGQRRGFDRMSAWCPPLEQDDVRHRRRRLVIEAAPVLGDRMFETRD